MVTARHLVALVPSPSPLPSFSLSRHPRCRWAPETVPAWGSSRGQAISNLQKQDPKGEDVLEIGDHSPLAVLSLH